MHGSFDRTGRRDVVVLDHDHVIEADAVINAAADQHRPFVQHAKPRNCLPRLQYARWVILQIGSMCTSEWEVISPCSLGHWHAHQDSSTSTVRTLPTFKLQLYRQLLRLPTQEQQSQAHIIQRLNCNSDNVCSVGGETCSYVASQCNTRPHAICINGLNTSVQTLQLRFCGGM